MGVDKYLQSIAVGRNEREGNFIFSPEYFHYVVADDMKVFDVFGEDVASVDVTVASCLNVAYKDKETVYRVLHDQETNTHSLVKTQGSVSSSSSETVLFTFESNQQFTFGEEGVFVVLTAVEEVERSSRIYSVTVQTRTSEGDISTGITRKFPVENGPVHLIGAADGFVYFGQHDLKWKRIICHIWDTRKRSFTSKSVKLDLDAERVMFTTTRGRQCRVLIFDSQEHEVWVSPPNLHELEDGATVNKFESYPYNFESFGYEVIFQHAVFSEGGTRYHAVPGTELNVNPSDQFRDELNEFRAFMNEREITPEAKEFFFQKLRADRSFFHAPLNEIREVVPVWEAVVQTMDDDSLALLHKALTTPVRRPRDEYEPVTLDEPLKRRYSTTNFSKRRRHTMLMTF